MRVEGLETVMQHIKMVIITAAEVYTEVKPEVYNADVMGYDEIHVLVLSVSFKSRENNRHVLTVLL